MSVAFVVGNGKSREPINLQDLKQFGKVYACNAVYRTFRPHYLIAVDVKMILEITQHRWQLDNEVWTNPNRTYNSISIEANQKVGVADLQHFGWLVICTDTIKFTY